MERAEQTTSPGDAADPDPQTVLIVDDEVAILESLAECLGDEGYGVATAGDGQDALDKLRRGLRPRVILLDLMMPRMTGWDFRKEQLNDPDLKDIPVIVITAANVSLASVRAHFGEVDLMPKPLSLEGLLALVRRHCGEPLH